MASDRRKRSGFQRATDHALFPKYFVCSIPATYQIVDLKGTVHAEEIGQMEYQAPDQKKSVVTGGGLPPSGAGIASGSQRGPAI